MDKTMEDVLYDSYVRWHKQFGNGMMESKEKYLKTISDSTEWKFILQGFSEHLTLTNKSRDEEIEKYSEQLQKQTILCAELENELNQFRNTWKNGLSESANLLTQKNQEIERLKGLLKNQFMIYNKSVMYENQRNMAWMDFEKENNL